MFTGIMSDTEGWNRFTTEDSRDKVIEWFSDWGVEVDEPNSNEYEWWNPSPTIISGEDHSMETFEGFQY